MYAQFFGNYLLSHNIVNNKQLLDAMAHIAKDKLSLGTIALYKGILTASETEEIYAEVKASGQRFGEIALERGLLTWGQAEELLREEHPDFLILGQSLVMSGAISCSELYDVFLDYQRDTELYNLEMNLDNKDRVESLIKKFFVLTEIKTTDFCTLYMNLVFENLIRFIGEDFIIKTPLIIDEYPVNYCTSQNVHGTNTDYISHIDMTEDVAIEFANRYAKENFTEFNEYVEASVQDFLNLQNGVYVVNMSNQYSIELGLQPPYAEPNDTLLNDGRDCLLIPVEYTFGTVNLMLSF